MNYEKKSHQNTLKNTYFTDAQDNPPLSKNTFEINKGFVKRKISVVVCNAKTKNVCKNGDVYKEYIRLKFDENSGTCIETNEKTLKFVKDCDTLDGWVLENTWSKCEGNKACTYEKWTYYDYSCQGGECVAIDTTPETRRKGCDVCEDRHYCSGNTVMVKEGYCEDGRCKYKSPRQVRVCSGTKTECCGDNVCTYKEVCSEGMCVDELIKEVDCDDKCGSAYDGWCYNGECRCD